MGALLNKAKTKTKKSGDGQARENKRPASCQGCKPDRSTLKPRSLASVTRHFFGKLPSVGQVVNIASPVIFAFKGVTAVVHPILIEAIWFI